MTSKQIENRMAKEMKKFELARQIRAILDAAKKDYGSEWDDDEMEAKIAELVFDE